MLTVDVLREVWEDIVTRHKVGLQFLSNWNPVLDDRTDIAYPVVMWGPLTTGLVANDQVLSETFTLDMLFLDQSRSDRPNAERDYHHSRMDAIAKQCWTLFHDRYITRTTQWQGVDVDVTTTTDPVFQPVYDAESQQRQGVRLTATVQSMSAPECVDDYFN